MRGQSLVIPSWNLKTLPLQVVVAFAISIRTGRSATVRNTAQYSWNAYSSVLFRAEEGNFENPKSTETYSACRRKSRSRRGGKLARADVGACAHPGGAG